jgi:hypothetical protein
MSAGMAAVLVIKNIESRVSPAFFSNHALTAFPPTSTSIITATNQMGKVHNMMTLPLLIHCVSVDDGGTVDLFCGGV